MVYKNKKKPISYKKKLRTKKKAKNKNRYLRQKIDYRNSSLFLFIKMVINFPYILINNIFLIALRFLKAFWSTLKEILIFSLRIKEALFGVVFGLLSGSIASVIIFSYLNFNSEIDKSINQQNIEDNASIKNQLSIIEVQISNIMSQNEQNKALLEQITSIEKKLAKTDKNSENNIEMLSSVNEQILQINKRSESIQKGLDKLEQDIVNNSKLMLSSSKTELSNRLYLAQSLVDRLKSGVPYSPQLVALGEQGLDPALLRYAKGGAPTLADLAARLSVRAGELKDADKTKRDTNWRDNIKSEISKYVKVKPTDINSIKGTSGALLRAEDAISRGNLEKAIKEVDSLTPGDRGVLNAWLSEAKARQNASIAAENLLAKTTAALRKRN